MSSQCCVYNLFLLPPNGEENNHCRLKPGVQDIKTSVHYIQVLAKQHTILIKHYSLITGREISVFCSILEFLNVESVASFLRWHPGSNAFGLPKLKGGATVGTE